MKRTLLMLLSLVLLCSPVTSGSQAGSDSYVDEAYHVELHYPKEWKKVSAAIDPNEFRGPDGYFKISATSGPSLRSEVNSLVYYKLRPYGTRPTIKYLLIQKQRACLILPSRDQSDEDEGAALFVTYPRAVEINGEKYGYFVLFADKRHIQEIAQSVRFFYR